MLEILSPAGSWDALVAAVQSGADAVYMGFGLYNARRNAQNFDDDSFQKAVSYCHLYGVKVYLTLNTLVFDREFPAIKDSLLKANEFGVDAVLIQDWGVYSLAKEIVPDLVLHASTQMSLFTLGGAIIAEEMGLSRIVLAREVSKKDMDTIIEHSNVEVEVFVHGALCMCYSGQCYISALIGQRSGNRGICAQPCRLPYQVNDISSNSYPLSLKDYNLSSHIPQLMSQGIACIKIEGRMKRPEYVAIVTSIYRRLVDENRGPTDLESSTLYQIFNRSGFTDHYYLGKKGSTMFGTRGSDHAEPENLLTFARSLYEKGDQRKISVSMDCTISNTGSSLRISDGCHSLSIHGDIPEMARNRSLTSEEVQTRLCKTGGTAFQCNDCSVTVEPGLMLSASSINALRRSALEAMETCRTRISYRRVLDERSFPSDNHSSDFLQYTVSISSPEQLTQELLSLNPAIVYIPIDCIDQIDKSLLSIVSHVCVVLPRVYRSEDNSFFLDVLQSCFHFDSVCISNIGQLPLARSLGCPIRTDFGLNITNSRSLLFMQQMGVTSATLSYELRFQQIRDMKKPVPAEAIVYGRLPLMIMENCIISHAGSCNCKQDNYLKDRMGESFPILHTYGCRNEIENSKTLFLADKNDYLNIGLTYGRLRFTTESPEDCVLAYQRYLQKNQWCPEDYTRGLFYRGVD